MSDVATSRRAVVRAIEQLIKSEISARDDSLGSYIEEKALDEAFEEYERSIFNQVRASIPQEYV